MMKYIVVRDNINDDEGSCARYSYIKDITKSIVDGSIHIKLGHTNSMRTIPSTESSVAKKIMNVIKKNPKCVQGEFKMIGIAK